jgi:hypothetical protein
MIGTCLVISGSFAAGVVAGVYLSEKGVLKVEDIRRSAKWVVETIHCEVHRTPPVPVPESLKRQVV